MANESIMLSSKSNLMSQLLMIKSNIDKRHDLRGQTICYLSIRQNQNALIYCRQLIFASQKVYKAYQDSYNKDFEETFYYRTSKAKEHLEFLLDKIIACRVFIGAKKREDALDVMEKAELDLPEYEPVKNILTAEDKLRFNEQQEIHSKMCGVLLSFVEIARSEKLHQYCVKYYEKYVQYVQKHYGFIEASTAYFKYGNYLYETKNFDKAEDAFKRCEQIRSKNAQNAPLIDVCVNLAICQRELSKYKQAIEHMIKAIQIHTDISSNPDGRDDLYLFLAKLYLQFGKFDLAYQNYLQCYKQREALLPSDPARMEIEVNFLFFYDTLKKTADPSTTIYSTNLITHNKELFEQLRKQAEEIRKKVWEKILKRVDFCKYLGFMSSMQAHLQLNISSQFFAMLSSEQALELSELKQKLSEVNLNRGVSDLCKCSFYQDKKIKIELLRANPDLRNLLAKRQKQK